ncbi:MAG TPA: hypothetical protein VKT54_13405 [Steroidobacteraceae bacterium]|nr:hypothetical protein [Steroidobacteraceae bacterium]
MNAPARAAMVADSKPALRTRLFEWLALGIAAVAFVGFARTYYLKGVFGSRALPLVVHLHGLMMSTWIVVFIAQTWLIAARRVAWHRRLGAGAAVLAALVILTGVALTVLALEREIQAHVQGMWHYLLLINLVNLLLFGAFVGSGLALRSRADVHKRLMLLAAVTLLAPAVARIALLFGHAPLPQFLAFYACIAACVLADTLRHGRLHPVLGWGGVAVIAAFQLSFFAVQTPGWMSIVYRVFGG